MPDNLDLPSLRRFARDLREIREDRDVSLAAIQEETQVHSSHLESFEAGTLHEEARMNEIYLKAFVRAYAEAVGLSADTVVEHLEAALSESYEDQLAVEFLEPPTSTDDPSEMAPPRGNEGGTPDRSARVEEESADDDDDADSVNEASRRSSSKESSGAPSDEVPPPEDTEESTDAGQGTSNEETEEPSYFSDLSEPADIDDESPRPLERGSRSTASVGSNAWGFMWNRRSLLFAVVGILSLLLVGWLVGGYLVGGDASPASSEPAAVESDRGAEVGQAPANDVVDTTASESQSRRSRPADVILGDTLHVTVRARSDVRELRVQQDDNLRRPYWIEAGEARVFPFMERITLENQLDSLQLLLEGYPYPTVRTDERGRVVIRRDTAEQFADTLRGDPVSVSETPDTIWGDGPSLPQDTLSSER